MVGGVVEQRGIAREGWGVREKVVRRKSSESSGAHHHEKRLGAPEGRTLTAADVSALRHERNRLLVRVAKQHRVQMWLREAVGDVKIQLKVR